MLKIRGAHKGNKRVAVADVGSGSAGVAILSIEHGKPARVEAVHRVILPFEERTEEQTISGIIGALSESAEKALVETNTKSGSIQNVYAVIRVPWMRSKSIRAIKKFAGEERVSSAVISDLARAALTEEKDFDHKNLIEASIVRVELNGYATANPVGKHAHIVFLSTLVSECGTRIRVGVEETIARIFSSKAMLRSGTGALLAVLRERSVSHSDYLVVDMTSVATSMFAVHKGAPAHHVLVPEGTRTILKRVGGSRMPEETVTLMRMLAREHCEDAACIEVKTGMARAEQELSRVFGEAIGQLALHGRLPNTLVLSVDPVFADWLSGFFSRIDFTQFTITTQPFSVEALTPESLKNLVISSDPTKATDLGLLVAAALVNSELQITR